MTDATLDRVYRIASIAIFVIGLAALIAAGY